MENLDLDALRQFTAIMNKELILHAKQLDELWKIIIELKSKMRQLEDKNSSFKQGLVLEFDELNANQKIQWEGIAEVLKQFKGRLENLERPKSEMYLPDTRPN